MIKQRRLAKPYKGAMDCFRQTYAHEGVRASWCGNGPIML
jgi:hypothetical protein